MTSIDPSRGHEVGFALSWHARVMTLAWAVIVPAAIFTARYLKIMPRQDWPRELDNKVWWHSHWIGQSIAFALSLVGISLILSGDQDFASVGLHRTLGYVVLGLASMQVLLGLFRGSKGGPTARAPDGSLHGDHYDMTPWRLHFERIHRVLGYLALVLGMMTVVSGLWSVNAPVWMWIAIANWWAILLILSIYCQAKGWAFDTYQAIWGDEPNLPGNKMKKMGWATRRHGEAQSKKKRNEKRTKGV